MLHKKHSGSLEPAPEGHDKTERNRIAKKQTGRAGDTPQIFPGRNRTLEGPVASAP